MTLRRYLVLAVVTLASAFGDTSLAVGMQRLRRFVGTSCYLTALTWADLTFVLPATSLAYVAVALLSRFWLHEQISPARWLGIALITAGVGFAREGPANTH